MKSYHKSKLPLSYTFDKDLQSRIEKTIHSSTNLNSQFRRQASQGTNIQSSPAQSNNQFSNLYSEKKASSSFLFASNSLPPHAQNQYVSQAICLPSEEKYQHNFIRQVRHPTPNVEKSRYRSRQSALVCHTT